MYEPVSATQLLGLQITGLHSFFLWLSSILVFMSTTFSLCSHQLVNILGCLHLLAIVNGAAMNM
jgi:hypothetical protein